jgi:hypothetical protein
MIIALRGKKRRSESQQEGGVYFCAGSASRSSESAISRCKPSEDAPETAVCAENFNNVAWIDMKTI